MQTRGRFVSVIISLLLLRRSYPKPHVFLIALISSLADFTSLSIIFVVFCCRNLALIMKISRCVYFSDNFELSKNSVFDIFYDFQSVIFSFLILSSLYKYFNNFLLHHRSCMAFRWVFVCWVSIYFWCDFKHISEKN